MFDFNVKSWSAKNTTLNKSSKNSGRTKRSIFVQKDPKIQTATKKSDSRPKNPTDEPECSESKGYESSHTIPDLNHTLSKESEREEKQNGKNSQQTGVVDYWLEDEICNSTLVEDKTVTEGCLQDYKNQEVFTDRSCFTTTNNLKSRLPDFLSSQKPAEVELISEESETEAEIVVVENRGKFATNKDPLNWLPPGPWNLDGKLDPNFRDWLAVEWKQRYGGTIHQKRADVLAHFRKDPANLVIRSLLMNCPAVPLFPLYS